MHPGQSCVYSLADPGRARSPSGFFSMASAVRPSSKASEPD
jgi:hypothetical protein